MGHLLEINSKKYAFIHIPKCGGVFFKSIFGLQSPDARLPQLANTVPSVSILMPSRNGHMTYAQFVKQFDEKRESIVGDYKKGAIFRSEDYPAYATR